MDYIIEFHSTLHKYKFKNMTDKIENHVLKKYEVLQKVGQGAYGVVWKVIDKKSK
jgi:mitogen-activated protein kinase 15